MKKFISLFIVTILMLTVFAENQITENYVPDIEDVAITVARLNYRNALPTYSDVLVDGKKIEFDSYIIDGSNYFKLRDLAYVFNNTAKWFEVEWSAENNLITITSGVRYTVVKGEMSSKGNIERVAKPADCRLIINGLETSLTAYYIEGNNYFKLRDLGLKLEFLVDWDEAANTVIIDTGSNDVAHQKTKRLVGTTENGYIPFADGENDGLSDILYTALYQNDILVSQYELSEKNNYKRAYYTDQKTRFVNYEDGYYLDMPKDMQFDFSKSKVITTAFTNDFSVVISKENSQNTNARSFIKNYFNRFILDEGYRTANDITLIENRVVGNAEILTIKLNNFYSYNYDTYSYVNIMTDNYDFYRLMFKYDSQNLKMTNIISTCIESFVPFKDNKIYNHKYSYSPIIPDFWTTETWNLYNSLVNTQAMKWGIYTFDVLSEGINKTIPELEAKLGNKFDIALCYTHLNGFVQEFPVEFMEKNYNEGRVVELTYQVTDNDNMNLYVKSPHLAIYKGEYEQQIRAFARGAKEFGKPFLFRLNNEMNTDWTNYSGVVNLSDPEIYVENWRRIYNIFKDEGVNNAIWVFNPNNHEFPPSRWNDFINYYPGDEYVQVFGVTGYNTGTYYAAEHGEGWSEFSDIYEHIDEIFSDPFGKFPWIITEFASSSVGGDKAGWIDRMFENLYKFPKIKAAVWFSSADLDMRTGRFDIVSRPYYLDETQETLNAFKRGFKK